MQCSVVIPCWNGADLTASCLASLLEQTGGHELEILIVDNASTDHTQSLAQLHPCITVLRQSSNLGFAGGVNAGIRAAKHPFVLLLNNDTQAATNLLTELHQALTSHPSIGAVAPVSNHVKGHAHLDVGCLGSTATGRAELAAELQEELPLQDVETLAGLCLLLRKETLLRIGAFDERFGHGNFEDDDYCLRMRLAGYRLVIARRAFLHHEGHATFKALGLNLNDEITKRMQQFCAKWQQDPAGAATSAALRDDVLQAADYAAAARCLYPNWVDADWHLARGCIRRNAPDAAIPHLRALLSSNPCHSDAAILLFECLLALDYESAALRAAAAAAATCRLDARSMRRIHECLGQHNHRRGDPRTAARHFAAALQAAPTAGELHNWLGVCQLELDELHAAERSFTSSAQLGVATGWNNLGIVRQRAGDWQGAEAAFAKAVAQDPADQAASNNLAQLRRVRPVAS